MVSRETLIVGHLLEMGLDTGAAPRLARFHDLLATTGISRGLLGPREGTRLLERHILESAALAQYVEGATLMDVGSGAGLPGLVLACFGARRTWLLEAERRRIDFLVEAVDLLDLPVRVLQGRAESTARDPRLRDSFDVAVARALAPPDVALELTLPFVRPGGRALLAVGPSTDLEACARAASKLAARPPSLEELRVPGLDAGRWVMIVHKSGVTPERYPRREGIPAKRPLGSER